jgi:hypothetical protein
VEENFGQSEGWDLTGTIENLKIAMTSLFCNRLGQVRYHCNRLDELYQNTENPEGGTTK